MDAAKELFRGPKIALNVSSLASMVDSVENCVSVFNQYGDGTITQLITAILEMKMESKIREDWHLAHPPDAIPDVEELLTFVRHRRAALESTDTGAAREKPPFRQQQQHKPFQQLKGKVGTNLHIHSPAGFVSNLTILAHVPSLKTWIYRIELVSSKKLAFATIVYALGTILEPVLVGMPVVRVVANTTRYCTNLVLQYNNLLCKPRRQLQLLLTTPLCLHSWLP